jgi:F-type H+-transporting ATPase subunit epsilon
MPDNVMQVDIVSPERILFSGSATMVVTRTLDGGEIAFQPNHAPFLAALTESHTRIYEDGGNVLHVAVHGGFVEVSNNKVSILSDVAELADQIDVTRAQAARDRAEEALRREVTEEDTAALRRAEARLAAAGRN